MLRTLTACSAVLVLALSAQAAGPVPQAVKDACGGDFKRHCGSHAPESPAARDCMAGAFDKLSEPCVTAILDSDLATEHAAAASDAARTAEAKAPPAHEGRASHAKPHRHADAGPKRRSTRAQARRQGGSGGKVAGYIRRGTGIAQHYATKYTRRAFAKAFALR